MLNKYQVLSSFVCHTMQVNIHDMLLVILLCLYIRTIGSDCPATGDNLAQLPGLDMRGINYTASGNSDQFLESKWYSAYGIEGQYQMVDHINIPEGGCGAFYAIYLEGPHPDYNDITPGEVISKTACLLSLTSLCDQRYDVKMRKCNARLEYYLEATIAQAAYCFDLSIANQGVVTSPDEAKPLSVDVKTSLIYVEKLSIRNNPYNHPELIFKCAFEMKQDYFYYAYWYINDNMIANKGPSQTDSDLYLSEPEIIAANYATLGFTVTCGIRVAKTTDGALTDIVKSSAFFAGIKVLDKTVSMKKSSTVSIRFEPTVPVGCDHTNGVNLECYHGMLMIDANKTDEYTCTGSDVNIKNNKLCGQNIQGSLNALDDEWHSEIHTMTIKTTFEDYSDKDVFTMLLRMADTGRGHLIWQNYFIDFITVIVNDDGKWKGRYCRSIVDPHVTTADGLPIENQLPGEYILYRNTEYKIEVQEKTSLCNRNRAYCACAVTVRAGGDIFTVHLCGGVRLMKFLSCKQSVLDVRILSDKLTYQVYTPIGTYIVIQILTTDPSSIWWNFINTYVYISPRDVGKSDGLCGYIDDDKSNDLIHRNGDTSPSNPNSHPITFTQSWTITEQESLLTPSNTVRDDTYDEERFMFCVCDKAIPGIGGVSDGLSEKAICSVADNQRCTKNLNFDDDSIAKTCPIRERRSSSTYYEEIWRRLSMAEKTSSGLTKRSDSTAETVQIPQATLDKCSEYLSNSFLAANMNYLGKAVNDSIYPCAFDVTVINNDSLTDEIMKMHKKSSDAVAQRLLKRDRVYREANQATLAAFINQTCDCNDHGTCNAGKCACDEGYKGGDCSIDITKGPNIDDTNYGGLCNRAEVSECSCVSFQSYNLFDVFYGRIFIKEVMPDNTYTVREVQMQCEPEDMFNGKCCVPQSRKRRSAEETQPFITEYDITISIDGVHFGTGQTVYVFDSNCQEHTDNNGNRYFSLKSGYCYIDGVCVDADAISSGDGCNKCLPSVSAFAWTQDCTDETDGTDEKKDYTVILLICTIVPAVVILGIAIGCYVKFQMKKRGAVTASTRSLKDIFASNRNNPTYMDDSIGELNRPDTPKCGSNNSNTAAFISKPRFHVSSLHGSNVYEQADIKQLHSGLICVE